MAINFDGTNDWYVRGGAVSPTQVDLSVSGSCSLFVYAKSGNWDTDGGSGSVGGLFVPVGEWGNDADGDFSLIRHIGSNVIRGTVRTSSGTYNAEVAYPSTGTWHPMAVVYNESTNDIDLYIGSSTSAANTTTAGTRSSRTAGIAMAAYPSNGVNTELNGDLAEAAFWDRVLTSQELIDLLDDDLDPNNAASDAILYYPMNTAPTSGNPIIDSGSAGEDLAEGNDGGSTSTHPVFASGHPKRRMMLGVG